jgi:hypothetical protein
MRSPPLTLAIRWDQQFSVCVSGDLASYFPASTSLCVRAFGSCVRTSTRRRIKLPYVSTCDRWPFPAICKDLGGLGYTYQSTKSRRGWWRSRRRRRGRNQPESLVRDAPAGCGVGRRRTCRTRTRKSTEPCQVGAQGIKKSNGGRGRSRGRRYPP